MSQTVTKVRYKNETYEAILFKDKADFRRWLAINHSKSNGIWVILLRKEAGPVNLTIAEATEEALCYGWIDSNGKRISPTRGILRYTPRRSDSPWSEINKKKALRLIREGKMTKAGMAKISEAKKNGRWARAYRLKRKQPLPVDMKRALKQDKAAWEFFNGLPTGYQNQYLLWVEEAKRPETRRDRIAKVVERTKGHKKPGAV